MIQEHLHPDDWNIGTSKKIKILKKFTTPFWFYFSVAENGIMVFAKQLYRWQIFKVSPERKMDHLACAMLSLVIDSVKWKLHFISDVSENGSTVMRMFEATGADNTRFARKFLKTLVKKWLAGCHWCLVFPND